MYLKCFAGLKPVLSRGIFGRTGSRHTKSHVWGGRSAPIALKPGSPESISLQLIDAEWAFKRPWNLTRGCFAGNARAGRGGPTKSPLVNRISGQTLRAQHRATRLRFMLNNLGGCKTRKQCLIYVLMELWSQGKCSCNLLQHGTVHLGTLLRPTKSSTQATFKELNEPQF